MEIRCAAFELTSRKKVIYGCPIAWQSPIFALMTDLNGFFAP